MIRAFNPHDKKELINLIRLNTPQYFSKVEEKDLSNYLDHKIEDYYVYEEEGIVIGCGGINYEDGDKTSIISWDIIHPKFQGKGVGKKLLLYRISKIKSNPSITCIKVRTSQYTYKFYEKCGFKLDITKKDYWAKGFDLYQMNFDLTIE